MVHSTIRQSLIAKTISSISGALIFCAVFLVPVAQGKGEQSVEAIKNISQRVKEMVKETTQKTVAIRITVYQTQPDNTVVKRYGWGSGAIISPLGHILTNAHVAEPGEELHVFTTWRKEPHVAKRLGINSVNDYALLKIDVDADEGVPYFELVKESPAVRDWVVALGHPGGPYKDMKPTVTIGRIQGLHRKAPIGFMQKFYDDAIQSDAPIFAGNSGGPLVNLKGELLGINGAMMLLTNIALSIPISEIERDLTDMKRGNLIPGRGPKDLMEFMKIVEQMNRDYGEENASKLFENTRAYRLIKVLLRLMAQREPQKPIVHGMTAEDDSKGRGALLVTVQEESLAWYAGLREGDIITQIGTRRLRPYTVFKGTPKEKHVSSVEMLESILQGVKEGESYSFKVLRVNRDLRHRETMELLCAFKKQDVTRDFGLKNAFALDSLSEEVNRLTVQLVQGEKRIGYGVIVDVQGFVLTADHLVQKVEDLSLRLFNGERVGDLSVVGRNGVLNVAMLKFNSRFPYRPLPIAEPAKLAVGDWVISGGSSTGPVAVGMVGALDREVPHDRKIPALGIFSLVHQLNKTPVRAFDAIIQHDSRLESDEFGTPLVTSDGKLAGINVGHFYPATNYAVPMHLVQQALPGLKKGLQIPLADKYKPQPQGMQSDDFFTRYFIGKRNEGNSVLRALDKLSENEKILQYLEDKLDGKNPAVPWGEIYEVLKDPELQEFVRKYFGI